MWVTFRFWGHDFDQKVFNNSICPLNNGLAPWIVGDTESMMYSPRGNKIIKLLRIGKTIISFENSGNSHNQHYLHEGLNCMACPLSWEGSSTGGRRRGAYHHMKEEEIAKKGVGGWVMGDFHLPNCIRKGAMWINISPVYGAERYKGWGTSCTGLG